MNDHLVLFNKGNAFYFAGEFEKAIRAYKEAIRIKPNYERAYFVLGEVYKTSGQRDKAKEAFENALRFKSNDNITHFNLGLLYKEEKNTEKAKYHIKRALDLGHEQAQTVLDNITSQQGNKPITKPKLSRFENHFNKANILLDKGKIKEAVFLFKEVIPNEPNADPNTYLPKSFLNPGYVHFCLGLQYEKNGDLKKAGFHLVLAVQIGNAPAKAVYEWMNRSDDLPRAPIRKLITGQKNPEQPLIRTLSGHTDSVQACAISPDGSFVVSAAGNMMKIYGYDNDNTLRVWNFKTGVERLKLSGHLETVKACAISKDASLIISVSEDCMKVWEAATGKELNHIETSGFACSECTDDVSIVVASLFVELIDIPSGKEKITILIDDLLHDCAISKDGSFIVTAGTDRHLVIWNAKNGEEIKYLKTPNNTNPYMDIRACSISPNDRFIVSGDEDGFLRIWDPKSVEETRVIKGHSNWITACAVSPDNTMIVSSSWDGTLKIWDVETGKNILALTGHTGAVNDCVFSTCGKYIISAGDDKTVKIWDISTLNQHKIIT